MYLSLYVKKKVIFFGENVIWDVAKSSISNYYLFFARGMEYARKTTVVDVMWKGASFINVVLCERDREALDGD